jgi:hypothetical protein
VTQLGSGFGSGYPSTIDTRQVYQNGVSPAPDSDTRVDSEFLNDTLTAIVQIETALGAGIQGAYASLAARIAAIESGEPGLTNVVAFTSQTMVSIPGAAHQQHQQALLYQVYDTSTPRQAILPESFSVYPTTYDTVVTFTLPQSGVIMVAALAPQYITAFTTTGTPPSVTIPGGTHGLGQTYLFFQAYDTATPAQAIEVGSVTVNATTKDLTLTTAVPQSGTLVLSVGSPRYAQAFTNATTVTVLGSAHGLASANLLYQVYDASTNPNAVQPGGLTVHPTTFDTVLTFAAPQSGTLVLAPVPSVSPPALLAVLPLTRAIPVPIRTTPLARTPSARLGTPADAAQLQTTVETLRAGLATLETLSTRLATLETAYQALLTQRGGAPPEDPTP